MERIFCIFGVVLLAAGFTLAQPAKRRIGSDEKLIAALINLRGIFGDDGVFVDTSLQTQDGRPSAVKHILDLGPRSIPLLIRHLDDMRLTNMTTSPLAEPVTVGDACLNILTWSVRHIRPMFDMECEKSELEGGCVEEKYGFGSPAFSIRGGKRVPRGGVRRAKRNWLIAYRRHKLHWEKY